VRGVQRRHFLRSVLAASAAVAAPRAAAALPMFDPFSPQPDRWRTFDLTTTIELAGAGGPAAAWIPVPALSAATWIKPAVNRWKTNATSAKLVRDPASATAMVYAQWAASAPPPDIAIVSRVATRDRTTDFTKPGTPSDLLPADRQRYSAAPAEIVRERAGTIAPGVTNELDKARAIYEWVVTNTFEDPQIAGCGTGDVAAMLTSGKLGGKSADINGLFVALARAAGLPARVLYGVRVAPSAFGYASLGAGGPDVTHEQHCRAEVFLTGFGWVPADPADVRHVIAAEPPGHLTLDDQVVIDARTALFGSWETNWVAYNDGQNVTLPGSELGAVPFLLYPQAEAGNARRDSLAADKFRYTIAVSELGA
jgi:transglutaminase-like putative cysteine protease